MADAEFRRPESTSSVLMKQSSKRNPEVVDRDYEASPPALIVPGKLAINHGELVAIIGSVGSGKSTFIRALLGELELVRGRKTLAGTASYAAQEPFIGNDSARQNIVFGCDFDAERYRETVNACCLDADFNMLSEGDETKIGGKGLNLSGGQKQRLSIARAVYHKDCEVYILDDPLSAVDSHVSSHIWEKVVMGLCKAKTRIVAINQLQYVSSCDRIIVLDCGKVVFNGTYRDLIRSNWKCVVYPKEGMASDSSGVSNARFRRNSSAETPSDSVSGKSSAGTQRSECVKGSEDESGFKIEEEHSSNGTVPLSIYWKYALASGGASFVGVAICLVIAVSVFYCSEHFLRVASDYWLSWWTEGTVGIEENISLGIYCGIYFLSVICIGIRALILQVGNVVSAKVIHQAVLKRVFQSPMIFFDTTPMGRILNRFTRDTDWVDNIVPVTLGQYLSAAGYTFTALLMIVVLLYWFILPLVPLAIVYFLIQRFYRRTSVALQRLSAACRSPVFVHFGETLHGLETIRAFKMQSAFIDKSQQRIDEDNRVFYVQQTTNQWLTLRLDMIGGLVIFLTALFSVGTRDSSIGINASQAGLALVYALDVVQFFKHFTRLGIELETRMNAVERMLEYCKIEQEEDSGKQFLKPPPHWPEKGCIEIENLTVGYRPTLPPALKGVSLKINGGERIGVVGRTGSGKSSILLALFRLLEPRRGSITIDGIDISLVRLEHLRKQLSIIPQDPVLFSGTVRSNLDPFDQHTDDELTTILEYVGLNMVFKERESTLTSPIGEYGANFSIGQRQLMCLCRAMLRSSSILVMDEATASIDTATDVLVHRVIRSHCSQQTVIIIAHRLESIMDCDRILVLSDGQVSEFDNPRNLLAITNGHFRAMVDATGKVMAKRLEAIAYRQLDPLEALQMKTMENKSGRPKGEVVSKILNKLKLRSKVKVTL